jgi:hypothetical protein
MAQRPDFESPVDNSTKQVYPIMTINMNGPPDNEPDGDKPADKHGKKPADRRRNLLSRVFKSYPSAIVFCQEPCGKLKKVAPEPNFAFVKTENKAAVIWSTKRFKRSKDGPETTDGQIMTIRDKICKENKDASDLLSRIAMVKLTPLLETQSTESILAVSFHGPRTKFQGPEGEGKKKKYVLSLLKFLDEVIKKKDIRIHSYIIGGDFNFDTSTITELLNLPEDVVVGSYELSPRSRDRAGAFIPYKDNFVYYPEPNLDVLLIKAIDLDRIDTEDSFLLDHDPIVGILHLTPQTDEGSQSEEVETLSKVLKGWKPF